MSACNCCSEPPCAAPVLECVSVSSECYSPACGEADPNQDMTPVDGVIPQARYCKTVTTHHGDGEGDTTKTYAVDEDGNCTSSCSGSWTHKLGKISGSYSGSQDDQSWTWTCWSSDGSTTYSYDGTAACVLSEVTDDEKHSGGSGSNTRTGESGESTCTDGVLITMVTSGGTTFRTESTSPDCGCTGAAPEAITPDTKDYSDCSEVPPCDLPEFPEFPDWPTYPPDDPIVFEDGQGDGCSAIRNWTEGGVSKNETKVQWRIRHSPTGTCYLKVWLRKTTTVTGDPTADPPVEDEVTTDDSETYEWEGTGNPCIDNPDDGASATSNDIIDEDDHAIDPPDENGSISIEILKYSCLRGYEPDVSDEDNPQPNGYPDPAWEAAAP